MLNQDYRSNIFYANAKWNYYLYQENKPLQDKHITDNFVLGL